MAAIPVPDEVLQDNIRALIRNGGNRSTTAKELGLPRSTLLDRITEAQKRFGLDLGRIADGRVEMPWTEKMPLPPKGRVARYVVTSAQNNTHLHPGWKNLKAYVDHLADLGPAQFIVGTFSYALDAYGAKSVKRGTWKPDDEGPWYAPEIVPFIRDERIELAPGLMWCGEMNILPTARNPLTGLETYNGRASNIVPHAKIALESVPSMPGEGVKLNYTTGAITQRNYIQKRAGITAEALHSYGGLLVEVNAAGDWWVRQLHIDDEGDVYDVGPSEGPTQKAPAVRISGGVVHTDAGVEAVTWGDIHTAEMDPEVAALGWGIGAEKGAACMVDELRPRRQIMHDIYSHRSRSHHEMRDFHAMYAKHVAGQDSVEGEVAHCAEFLRLASRDWCETIIVPSNHDRHLDRWLNDEDPRKDPPNARYHLHLQATVLDAIRERKRQSTLEVALREKGIPDSVRFLREDESFVICRGIDGGIECGLHGDLGANGARGSTRNLTRLGRAVNKGHDHTASIREHVYSAGACSLRFPYMKGPSSHSVSHIVTFENGKRQIITMWAGRWRA